MEEIIYCGYIKDKVKLQQAASGGLATAMTDNIMASGNIVYGAAYTKDFRGAEYIRVTSAQEARLLKGSKYVKAMLNKKIFENIANDLSDGKTVLFIGLPCDVGAVSEYLKKNDLTDKSIILVDLICHGPGESEIAKEYLDNLEKRFKSRLTELSVRYKNPYWTPPYLFAKFENGKEYIQLFNISNYGVAFSMMPRRVCYNCKFKNNYKSDITIGDFWGVQECDDGYNKYGTSIAFVHTERGNKFINSLDNFSLYAAEAEKAIKGNPMYIKRVELTEARIKFKENYEKRGLNYAVRKSLNTKLKIIKLFSMSKIGKKILKNIIYK